MPETIKLNKQTIDALATPKKRTEYQDSQITAFRLRISPSGVKAFSVIRRIPKGGVVRVTLGKYSDITPTNARKMAIEYISMMVQGENPNAKKRISDISLTTLKTAFNCYLDNRKLKDKTLYNYKNLMKTHLRHLVDLPLADITRRDIVKTHRMIASDAQANYAMRVLRAVFNFSKLEYLNDDESLIFTKNPVDILSHRKQWHKNKRKQTHLRRSHIPLFLDLLPDMKANETHTGQSICDAMLFALITGLRRNEIFNLKWQDIHSDYFIINDTKNGIPFELPITCHITDILQCRKAIQLKSDYVFSAENKKGKIIEPKKVVNKIKCASGLACNFHDLRRTFATTAEQLDIGSYKLKRLLNHSTGRDDVTAGYTILTAETLYDSSLAIQNKLLGISCRQ